MKSKKFLSAAIIASGLLLSSCSNAEEEPVEEGSPGKPLEEEGSHEEMDHSSSGEVPDTLEEAEDPKYPVDSEATILTDHMPGMDGAIATITGAYDTIAYEVSYTPTNGVDPVENHKWVVHEELEDSGEAPLEQGDEAVMNATHMEGMKGATATVDSAEQTTVYMISYVDTETGDTVENHKWVTEAELEAAE